MPSRLPLFPLNLVLFPGELLPLHIFEPRYRQLLFDCLASDHRFGITVADPPGRGAIGCVARIRGAEPVGDGRSNIMVLGERRFGVRALLDEGTPYPVATIEEFADEPDSAPLPTEQEELRRLGAELRLALGILADQPGDEATWAEDGETLSFQIASLAEMDLETRVRLLSGRSTRERARALIGLLPPLVAEAKLRAEIHVRARANGKGHHDRDIVVG
jgi:Lon protease-like protein